MPEIKPRWLLTCSCGWTTALSSRWAAESAGKLHPKLGEPDTAHTVRVETPPDETRRQPELPLA
jgi:hypothetical protein